jgi:hypothetical protein
VQSSAKVTQELHDQIYMLTAEFARRMEPQMPGIKWTIGLTVERMIAALRRDPGGNGLTDDLEVDAIADANQRAERPTGTLGVASVRGEGFRTHYACQVEDPAQSFESDLAEQPNKTRTSH